VRRAYGRKVRRSLAPAILICAVLTSCASAASETNDTTGTAATEPPTVVTQATTPGPTSPKTSETSTVVPTPAPPATAEPTSIPTSTYGSEGVGSDVEADIRRRISQIEDSWAYCLQTLPECSTTPLLAFRTGEQADEVTSQVNLWNSSRYSSRGVETRSQEVIAVRVEGPSAQVDVCQVDASVLFIEADAVPGQPEMIVDDDWISTTQTWNLRLVDGEWLAESITNREISIGEENNKCSN
jgi:hypothetical protein